MKLIGNRRRTVTVTVAGGYEVNVRTSAGSPTDAVDVIVNVSGVVYPSGPAAWALRFGTGWPADCSFRLNNAGSIYGAGASGGNAGNPGGNGADGGPAINLDGNPVSIDNSAGYILAGGGGGAGGTAVTFTTGGGGGGGAGWDGVGGGAGGSGSGGTDGNDGTIAAGGPGGSGMNNGGNGGGLGASGDPASPSGGAGGAAGKAVDLAGGAVTWLGGYNSTQVQGGVS